MLNSVVKIFDVNGIPWSNLVSMLMNLYAVMRGSKSGFETSIHENVCPQLVDVDGDSCHHIHNCCKKFCKPFENHVENLFHDLHTDSKWTADVKTNLQKICNILNIKYTAQDNNVPHRWLSVYDVAMSTQSLFDAYMIYYYGFLPNDAKQDYNGLIQPLMESLTTENINKIKNIHTNSEKKKNHLPKQEKIELLKNCFMILKQPA